MTDTYVREPIPFEVRAIRDKVCELASLDGARRVFGSGSHRYVFNCPARPHEVSDFERNHTVELPAEYRFFLLEVGNGGVGPNYGLKALSEAAMGHEPKLTFMGDPASSPVHSGPGLGCPARGCIWLSDNGCASADELVLNGELRGSVWTNEEARDYRCAQSFAEWYTGWLASAIATIRREPLICQIKRRMHLEDVRKVFGQEIVPHDPREALHDGYWLAFRDCNAYFEFDLADRVVRIDHKSHVICGHL